MRRGSMLNRCPRETGDYHGGRPGGEGGGQAEGTSVADITVGDGERQKECEWAPSL